MQEKLEKIPGEVYVRIHVTWKGSHT